MKRFDFITPHYGLNSDHLQSLRHSIENKYATWGSMEAMKFCDVITIYLDDDESQDRIEKFFLRGGYYNIKYVSFDSSGRFDYNTNQTLI